MTTTARSETLAVKTAAKPSVTPDRFATSLGVLTATLGSAVGLGNIWKFPYLTGENGGAAFLLISLACTLLVGLPIIVTEHMIGRKGRGDAITSLRRLAPNGPWWLIGASGVLAAFLIMAFYSEVAGWVFAYIFKSASAGALSTDPATTSAAFDSLVTNPVLSLFWQWFVLILVGIIIMIGVSKGIEATTKRLMPVLFGLLLVLCVRSLTLPGAAEGLTFLFKPDFSKVTGEVILVALGLAFFKLSIGMGTMITYGSYYGDDQNIPVNASRVVFADLAVSLLAGIAIFPAVFAFGFQPEAGPSLLFITIPAVFASMPAGQVFMALFFVLTGIASLGAQLSLIEVPTAYLIHRFKMSRKWATIITISSLMVVGSTAALSNSLLSHVKLFGKSPFDLFDYVSSNILLPVGGLFLALLAGWVLRYDFFKEALSNGGKLKNERFVRFLYIIVAFVTPLLVFLILLNSLNLF